MPKNMLIKSGPVLLAGINLTGYSGSAPLANHLTNGCAAPVSI